MERSRWIWNMFWRQNWWDPVIVGSKGEGKGAGGQEWPLASVTRPTVVLLTEEHQVRDGSRMKSSTCILLISWDAIRSWSRNGWLRWTWRLAWIKVDGERGKRPRGEKACEERLRANREFCTRSFTHWTELTEPRGPIDPGFQAPSGHPADCLPLSRPGQWLCVGKNKNKNGNKNGVDWHKIPLGEVSLGDMAKPPYKVD